MLETVIVLGVVSVFGLVVWFVQADVTTRVQARLFLSHVQRQLVVAQTYAMTSGEDTQVWLDEIFAESNVPNSMRVTIPDNVNVSPYRYIFSGRSGQLKAYKQLILETSDRKYTVRVQFGKGVFWVEEMQR